MNTSRSIFGYLNRERGMTIGLPLQPAELENFEKIKKRSPYISA